MALNIKKHAGKKSIDETGINLIVWGLPGSGKAQPLSSRILTPTGYKLMGDIQVGDEIIAGNGQTTTVLGVYPQGKKQIVEFTLRDGRKVEASLDHLWETSSNNLRKGNNDFTVIQTSAQIMARLDNLEGKSSHSRPSIPNNVTELNPRVVPLHPYLLGMLIAEGGLSGNTVRFTNINRHHIDKVASLLPEADKLSRISDTISYGIARKVRNNDTADTHKHLTSLGLMGTKSEDKFIPQDYLWNSLENRIELAKGLIDGDGYVGSKTIEYTTVSPQLAQDVAWLMRSLGCEVKVSEKQGSYKKSDKTVVKCQQAYRLSIRCSDSSLFSSDPKAGKSQYSLDWLLIDSYKLLGEKECQCIYVANNSHTYKTEDFVVTHNTTLASTFPDVLYIDTEAGTKFIENEMDVATVKSWQEVKEVIEIMQSGQYKTVVFDVVDEIYTLYMDFLKEQAPRLFTSQGSPTMQGWGTIKEGWRKFCKIMCIESSFNTIFVGHEKVVKDDEGKIVGLDLKMTGSAGSELVGFVDFVGYKADKFQIDFRETSLVTSVKDRHGKFIELDSPIYNPSYDMFVGLVKGTFPAEAATLPARFTSKQHALDTCLGLGYTEEQFNEMMASITAPKKAVELRKLIYNNLITPAKSK